MSAEVVGAASRHQRMRRTEGASGLPWGHVVAGSRQVGAAERHADRRHLAPAHQRRGRITSGRKLPSFLPTSVLMSSLSNAFMRNLRSLFFSGSPAKVVLLERVVLQIEKLNIVVAQDLFRGRGRIEIVGRVVPRELVEREAHEAPFPEFRLKVGYLRRGSVLEQFSHAGQAVVTRPPCGPRAAVAAKAPAAALIPSRPAEPSDCRRLILPAVRPSLEFGGVDESSGWSVIPRSPRCRFPMS